MTILSLVCILALLACSFVCNEGHRIKIALFPLGMQSMDPIGISKRAISACNDYKEVNKSTLSLPKGFETLPEPWNSSNLLDVKVYRSESVSSGIEHALNLTVPGLGGSTVRDVFDYLKVQGPCWIFPFGGVVRDQFLGQHPNDVDAEISCSADRVRGLCTAKWGSSNCENVGDANRRSFYTYIGSRNAAVATGNTEGIDMAGWEVTFFGNLSDFEYTANSLAYDIYGNQVVLDFTSTGMVDVCSKKIRIPASADHWNSWENSLKVYRYWKLRFKGFSSVDLNTSNYIVHEAKSSLVHRGETFTTFYCRYVLIGTYSAMDNSCSIKNCSSVMNKTELYGNVFAEDMGNFWKETAKPVADGILQACGCLLLSPSLGLLASLIVVAYGVGDSSPV